MYCQCYGIVLTYPRELVLDENIYFYGFAEFQTVRSFENIITIYNMCYTLRYYYVNNE